MFEGFITGGSRILVGDSLTSEVLVIGIGIVEQRMLVVKLLHLLAIFVRLIGKILCRWLVMGGSWGVTLALAYAQSHPDSVAGLILRGVCLLRPQEIDWFYKQVFQA